MRSVITISLALAVFGAAAAQAPANDCVFNASVGNWGTGANWLGCDDGYPSTGDSATILSGQTCTATGAFQATYTVVCIDVKAGGTLRVTGCNLILEVQGQDCIVDGTLYFAVEASTTPGLGILEDVTLKGSGTITGEPGDLYLIWSADLFAGYEVSVGGDLTVEGSMKPLDVNLVNNGTFRVTNSLDTMYLGDTQVANGLTGTGGAFEVTAGTLQLGDVDFGVAPSLAWTVDGGTLEITSDCTDCGHFQGDIVINDSAALLDVDADLCTRQNLTFSGGTIDVAASTSAHFSAASCP